MPVPNDRKYSESHEWFKVEGDAIRIGISQFAADELTDITFVDLPKVGSQIKAGTAFGEIESVKATAELKTLVSGEIIEVNTRLSDEPGLVNSDPFNNGWMVRVKPSDTSALGAAMDGAAYEAKVGK